MSVILYLHLILLISSRILGFRLVRHLRRQWIEGHFWRPVVSGRDEGPFPRVSSCRYLLLVSYSPIHYGTSSDRVTEEVGSNIHKFSLLLTRVIVSNHSRVFQSKVTRSS